MSAFITFVVNNHPNIKLLKYKLEAEAKKLCMGLYTENRYIEPQLEKIMNISPKSLAFDLADSAEYNNCEKLLEPWWFLDNNISRFNEHMNKIFTMARLCLEGVTEVNLDVWIGDSGDYNFDVESIELASFVSSLTEIYNKTPILPPNVHYIIST